ncbi:MAG: CcmD family protein [Gemmatimonadetes bacterium]|nr:CcmD family protein [Gemmatimonadota bacterium]
MTGIVDDIVASNWSFIYAAYGVTWVVILGYLVRLVRAGARANADYARLVPGAGGEGAR